MLLVEHDILLLGLSVKTADEEQQTNANHQSTRNCLEIKKKSLFKLDANENSQTKLLPVQKALVRINKLSIYYL